MIGAGSFASRAVNLAMLPVYTRFLSPGEYGAADLVATIAALAGPLLTVDVASALFRFLVDAREDPARQRALVSTALIAAAAATVPVCVIGGAVGALLGWRVAPLCAAYLLAATASGLATQAARGLGKTAAFAFSGLAGAVAAVAVNLWLVVGFRLGLEGMLVGMTAAAVVAAIVTGSRLPLRSLISWRAGDRRLWRAMAAFSGPLVVSSVAWWAITLSDRTVVAVALGVSAAGILGVANRFALVLDLLCAVFALAWAESAAEQIAAKDRDVFFNRVLDHAIRGFGGALMVVMMGAAVVFPLLAGPEFAAARAYVPPLLAGAFLHGIANIPSGVYTATRLTGRAMKTSIIAGAVNLAVNLALVWVIGIWAAAASTIAAFAVMIAIRFKDLRPIVALRVRPATAWPLAAACAAVGCCYYLPGVGWTAAGCAVAAAVAAWLNRNLAARARAALGRHAPAWSRRAKRRAERGAFRASLTVRRAWARRGGGRCVLLLGTPTHGNLGDHAIVLAVRHLLADGGFRGRVIEIADRAYHRHAACIQAHAAPDDLVAIHGGGNLGTVWPLEDDKITDIIQRFKDHHILVFPETCHYDQGPDAEQRLRRNQAAYQAARRLTLMLRDRASLDFARRHFPTAQTTLVPDSVLSTHNAPTSRRRSGVLVCLRTDREQANRGLQAAAARILELKQLPSQTIDTVIPGNLSRRERRRAVRRIWRRFARSELVITDRLHGMVFAAITATPCAAFDNTTGKVKGTYAFLRHLHYIRFLDDPQDLDRVIDQLIGAPAAYRFDYPAVPLPPAKHPLLPTRAP
jgi:pyruvyl transferase EpsI